MIEDKQALSHYEFIKQISLAWVNKKRYWPKAIQKNTQKRKENNTTHPFRCGTDVTLVHIGTHGKRTGVRVADDQSYVRVVSKKCFSPLFKGSATVIARALMH